MLRLITNLCVLAIVVIAEQVSIDSFNITLHGCVSKPTCGNVPIDKQDKKDVIECYADISGPIHDTSLTAFWYKGANIIDHVCTLNLNKGKCNEKIYCRCFNESRIVYNVTAKYDDSNAEIKAAIGIYNTTTKKYSNIFIAPPIYKDPRNTNYQLLVNHQPVKNNSAVNVSNEIDELPLNLSPKENEQVLSLHYAVENQILTNGSEVRLKPDKINIKIKLCDEELQNYNLRLHYEDDPKKTTPITIESSTKKTSQDADKSCNIFFIMMIVFIIAFVLVIVLAICIYCLCRKKNKELQSTIKSLREILKEHDPAYVNNLEEIELAVKKTQHIPLLGCYQESQ